MPKHDWPRIEAEYRMGRKTLREIAREHGLSHTAVAKHMQKRGIQQDLSDQVRAVAAAEVVKAEVAKLQQQVADTVSTVQLAGQVAAAIEMKQRGRLARLTQMAEQLAKDPELGDGASEYDREQALARRLALLTDVEAKLVPLERKVYRLDVEAPSENSVEAWIKSKQG